jgi:hypothetical protein
MLITILATKCMKITYIKLLHKTRAVLIGALLLSSAGVFSMTLADVPVRQNDMVECLCATSNSQTCVTSSFGGFLVGDILSSCDADGNYTVADTSDTVGPWYDPAAVGNPFLGVGELIQKCGFPDINGIQSCTSSIAKFNGTPLFSPFISITIGDDTNVSCRRGNGVTGTLHLTGTYLTYFSIGSAGGDGNGGGASGDISSGWIPMAHNFSCY